MCLGEYPTSCLTYGVSMQTVGDEGFNYAETYYSQIISVGTTCKF